MKPKLEISPDFTLEDIRKIRDYNYEMTKNMNTEEMVAYYRKGAESAFKRMAELREEKKKNQWSQKLEIWVTGMYEIVFQDSYAEKTQRAKKGSRDIRQSVS